MKLRTRFIIFISVIHIILLILAYEILIDNKLLFVASELIILISILISIKLYKSFVRPLNLISQGIDALKDQDFSTKFTKVGQQEVDQLILLYNRMIDQLREERITQQEQQYFLQNLIKASPTGIIILNYDNEILIVNPAAETLLHLDMHSIRGKKLSEMPGYFFNQLAEMPGDEARIMVRNGMEIYKCQKAHFLDRGFKMHFIIIEELSDEILRSEKKAYEKIIRMMSHEVNNSIGAINSILDSSMTYKKQLTKNDQTDFESGIKVAIDRNNQLNKFMANFADVIRTPDTKKENTDLIKIIKHACQLMKTQLDAQNIVLEWKPAEDNFPVTVDIIQFEQIILNILKNSIEAIGQHGRIIIETTITPHKSLQIKDTGKGIDPKTQQQLFTPFFSTKKGGQGIGLTLIREILHRHGFHFSLQTENGLTVFRILFD